MRATLSGTLAAAIAWAAALALGAAPLAGAQSAKAAKATVKYHGSTYKFAGGHCKRILDGFSLNIGKLTGAKYFELQSLQSLKKGTYKGAVVGLHVNGRYLSTRHATVTITNQAHRGTFSGKFKNDQTHANAGSFKGNFTC